MSNTKTTRFVVTTILSLATIVPLTLCAYAAGRFMGEKDAKSEAQLRYQLLGDVHLISLRNLASGISGPERESLVKDFQNFVQAADGMNPDIRTLVLGMELLYDPDVKGQDKYGAALQRVRNDVRRTW